MHGRAGLPNIIDIRTIGLVAGIELEPHPGAAGARAFDLFAHYFERGLLFRVTGDIVAPIVTCDQIDRIANMFAEAIRHLT